MKINKYKLYLFCTALFFRVFALIMERSIGIDIYFHPDSQYYVENAKLLFSLDIGEMLEHYTHNLVYIFIVAITLELFGDPFFLIILNIIVGSLSASLVYEIIEKHGNSKKIALYGGLIIVILPYHIHLSIHILKDILFIYIALKMIDYIYYKKKILYSLCLTIGLWLRPLIIFPLFVFAVLNKYLLKKPKLFFLSFLFIFTFFGSDIMTAIIDRRSNIFFEGRSFFNSIEIIIPTNFIELLGYILTIPLRDIFIPNIFYAQSMVEFIFAINELIFQVISLIYLYLVLTTRMKYKFNSSYFYFFILYLFSIVMIDLATPGMGPLVRYKQIAMIFFLISFFIYCSHSLNYKKKTRS